MWGEEERLSEQHGRHASSCRSGGMGRILTKACKGAGGRCGMRVGTYHGIRGVGNRVMDGYRWGDFWMQRGVWVGVWVCGWVGGVESLYEPASVESHDN
eukprot:755848-Hanusia_phi.AAC.6